MQAIGRVVAARFLSAVIYAAALFSVIFAASVIDSLLDGRTLAEAFARTMRSWVLIAVMAAWVALILANADWICAAPIWGAKKVWSLVRGK